MKKINKGKADPEYLCCVIYVLNDLNMMNYLILAEHIAG